MIKTLLNMLRAIPCLFLYATVCSADVCPRLSDSAYDIRPWARDVKPICVFLKNDNTFDALRNAVKNHEDEDEDEDEESIQSDKNTVIDAVNELIVVRVKGEVKFWAKSVLLQDVCEGNDKNYMPTLCSVYVTDNPTKVADVVYSHALRDDLITLPACTIYQNSTDDKAWAYYVTSMMRSIRKGGNPKLLLAGLGDKQELKEACRKKDAVPNASCRLYLTGALMQAGLSDSDLKNDARSQAIYLRLVDKLDNDNVTLKYLSEWECDWKKSATPTRLIDNITILEQKIKALEDAIEKAADTTQDDIQDRIKSRTLALMQAVGTTLSDAQDAFEPANSTIADLSSITKLAANLEAGEYAQSVIEARTFLKTGCEVKESEYWYGRDNKCCSKIIDHLDFAMALAEMHYSVDAREFLESYLEPTGYWLQKRKSNYNFSFGAIAGVGYGDEELSKDAFSSTGKYYGLFLPVGFDMQVFSTRWVTGGFFFSVVDFGPMLSTQNSDEGSINSESEKGFSQLLSPGIYLRFGLGRTPLFLGFGRAYTPSLRTGDVNGVETELNSRRDTLFIGMDLPLLGF